MTSLTNTPAFKAMVVIFLLIWILFIFFSYSFPLYCVEKERSENFVINLNYDQVRKIFVRTNALEKIVAYQQGELVYKHLSGFNVSANRIFSPWEINGQIDFIVRTSEYSEIGTHLLKFHSDVHISKNQMVINTKLIEHCDNLKKYEQLTVFKRSGDVTRVSVKLKVKYCRYVPVNMKEKVDYEIGKYLENSLISTKESILDISNKYANKRIIIPIPIGDKN